MTAKAVKGPTISFTKIGKEVKGVSVLAGGGERGERKQSVEPLVLSRLLVNLY